MLHIIHRTYIADRIVKLIRKEIITLDQTQIKIQTNLIQTLGIETIAMIVQEMLQTTENETLQIFDIEIIRITITKLLQE